MLAAGLGGHSHPCRPRGEALHPKGPRPFPADPSSVPSLVSGSRQAWHSWGLPATGSDGLVASMTSSVSHPGRQGRGPVSRQSLPETLCEGP